MSENIYNPPDHISSVAHCSSMKQYKEMSEKSINDPEAFWGKIAKEFHFQKESSGKFLDYNFDVNKGEIYIKWMEGAKTNIAYNCLDRHVDNGKGDNIAFYW